MQHRTGTPGTQAHPATLGLVLKKHGLGLVVGAVCAILGAKLGTAASSPPVPVRDCPAPSIDPEFQLPITSM